MATAQHAELRARYEEFLRLERHGNVDKITSALDECASHSHNTNNSKSHAINNNSSNSSYPCPRVKISLSDLRSSEPQLTQELQQDPFRHIRALEAAAHTIAEEEREGYSIKFHHKIKVSLTGPVSSSASSPRSLTSDSLRQLICVEGVTTKVSSARPKLVKSVHYCPATGMHEERVYRDATDEELNLPSLDSYGVEQPDRIQGITSSVYPTNDKTGNALETEYGMSQYKDYQVMTLQEMPERAPHGQLPRSVDLILNHDLVDKVKAGDRVQVVGVYRALAPGAGSQQTSGVFRTVVIVNHIQVLGRDTTNLVFSPDDIRNIRQLSQSKEILKVLGRSLAPGIYGHEVIKRALILQLLGGCERNLKSGTKLRGDVNMLLLGDPSTAKSQLLRAMMSLAPLAVSTTGKGSSGVGLTAAVTSDADTKERRLEAGAMVLADRGIVLIDEFDKMSEADRVTIHEAMEQQTITIAKAGIYASLNARCAVLAAANPVYGQYDRTRRVQENIGLPDSLLSRFDLLFVVLDQLDPEHDRCIANHVLAGHRYRRPGTGMEPELPQYNNGLDSFDGDTDDEDGVLAALDANHSNNNKKKSMWMRSHHHTTLMMMNGSSNNDDANGVEMEDDEDEHVNDVLNQEFLRKYIHFAKTRIKPVLTEEAREAIAGKYADMRSRQDERTLPVTARSLETVIRLASAHAKARLSPVVEAEPDVSSAMDILAFALYHEEQQSAVDANTAVVSVSSEEGESDVDAVDNDTADGHAEDATMMPPSSKKARVNAGSESDIDVIKKRIWEAVRSAGEHGEVSLSDICKDVDDDLKAEAVRQLGDRIMEDNGLLFMV